MPTDRVFLRHSRQLTQRLLRPVLHSRQGFWPAGSLQPHTFVIFSAGQDGVMAAGTRQLCIKLVLLYFCILSSEFFEFRQKTKPLTQTGLWEHWWQSRCNELYANFKVVRPEQLTEADCRCPMKWMGNVLSLSDSDFHRTKGPPLCTNPFEEVAYLAVSK